MISIHDLKIAQAYAHPAIHLWKGPVTKENVGQFPFSKIDQASINLQARIQWNRELKESQKRWLDSLHKLIPVENFPRLNYMRLLIGKLVLKPADLKVQSIGKSSLEGANFIYEWNRLLFTAYFEIERRAYPNEQEITGCLLNILNNLDLLLTFRAAFHKPKGFEERVRALQLFKDVCEAPEELAPCLFIAGLDQPNKVNSKKLIKLFRNVLELTEAPIGILTPGQVSLRSKDRAFASEFKKVTNQLKSQLNETKKKFDHILNLFSKVKRGDRNSYLLLRKALENFHPDAYFLFQTQLVKEARNKEIVEWAINPMAAAMTLIERFHRAALSQLLGDITKACCFIQRFQDAVELKAHLMSPLDALRMRWVDQILALGADEEKKSMAVSRLMLLNVILTLFERSGSNAKLPSGLNIKFNPNEFKECEWLDALINDCQGRVPNIIGHWLVSPLSAEPKQKDLSHLEDELFLQFAGVWKLLSLGQNPWVNRVLKGSDLNDPEAVLALIDALDEVEYYAHLIAALEKAEIEVKSVETLQTVMILDTFDLVKNLYARPLLSMGWEKNQDPKDKKTKNSSSLPVADFDTAAVQADEEVTIKEIELPTTLQKNFLEAFDGLLKNASRELKVQLLSLVELLRKPVSWEALYEKAALCLEAHLKPEESHNLSSKGNDEGVKDWLDKMQHFLPISFRRPKISEKDVWADVKMTAALLGTEPFQEGSLTKMKLPRAHVEELAPVKIRIPKRGEYQCQELPEEQKLDVTLRNSFFDLIRSKLPHLIDDIKPLVSLCQTDVCSSECLSHLMQKTGLLVEGALKLHLLHLPIKGRENPGRHCSFDQVGQRPLRYDHHLRRLYAWIEDKLTLDPSEILLLEKWQDYATWTRYPDAIDAPLNTFLREASLLYQDFHTEEEAKLVAKIGFPGGSKEELFRRQKEELVPDLKALFQLVDKLLTTLR